MEFTRAEVCVAAASDSWRDAGEVLAHAVGTVPALSARLARLTHSPDLVLSDGEAFFMSEVSGRYLQEALFGPGARNRWDDAVQGAAGERLNQDYFVNSLH